MRLVMKLKLRIILKVNEKAKVRILFVELWNPRLTSVVGQGLTG
jgi:hypothetical protein